MRDTLRDASVLVTGATGFLGSHLTRRLVAEQARVNILAREHSSFSRLSDLTSSVTCWTCDLRDEKAIEDCVARVKPDLVFHLAGVTAGRRQLDAVAPDVVMESYDVNVTGTLRLLLALGRAAPGARVVRVGGLEEYGSGPLPYSEEQREAPISAYSATQVAATHIAHTVGRQAGLPLTTLRPAVIYGPGQSTAFFIPALILACLRGHPFDMTKGEQTRDYVYVDDVVTALMEAGVASGVRDQVINIGSGREHRIRDVAALVVRLTGSATELRIGSLAARGMDLDRQVCDPRRARELLHWEARTSIEEGLERTVAWYRRTVGESAMLQAG